MPSDSRLLNTIRLTLLAWQFRFTYKQVAKLSPMIVFIFGGPGTQKGKYIDYLVDLYGLHCITISKVLEEELGVICVYEMTTSDLANITINIVLQWFVQRMERNKNAPGFVIDIVPNIKVTLFFHFWSRETY